MFLLLIPYEVTTKCILQKHLAKFTRDVRNEEENTSGSLYVKLTSQIHACQAQVYERLKA